MDYNNVFDEKAVLKEVQKDFAGIAKYFDQITKAKVNDPEALDKIEKALRSLPPGETVGKVIEELRQKAASVVDEARKVRSSSFKRIQTEFLKMAKDKGKTMRETSNGWRIGYLEFQAKPELAQVRFAYNREPMGSWMPVGSVEDIEKLEEKTLAALEKSAVLEDALVQICFEAYNQARNRQSGKADRNLVPIVEFYREFRIALIRHQFNGKAPHSKIGGFLDFPRWAFLFNMDRYRSLGASIRAEMKIGMQTGSQQEVSQGKGMVVNGLDPMQDYKVMCYVVAAKGADR